MFQGNQAIAANGIQSAQPALTGNAQNQGQRTNGLSHLVRRLSALLLGCLQRSSSNSVQSVGNNHINLVQTNNPNVQGPNEINAQDNRGRTALNRAAQPTEGMLTLLLL